MIITTGKLEKFFPEKLALLKNGHERELSSTQTMKNGEGLTGIRNRSWEAGSVIFRQLERRGGVSSEAAQVITGMELALPEITEIVLFSREILKTFL